MAKELDKSLRMVTSIIVGEDGEVEVQVDAFYGVHCEYGKLPKRGLPIDLPPNVVAQMKAIAKNVVVPQCKADMDKEDEPEPEP